LAGASLAACPALPLRRRLLQAVPACRRRLLSLAWNPLSREHALQTMQLPFLIPTTLVKSRVNVAGRHWASVASTMTSSPLVCRKSLVSPLRAVSATTPLRIMASRTARRHASLAGASLAACPALPLRRRLLQAVLACRRRLLSLAWRYLCDYF